MHAMDREPMPRAGRRAKDSAAQAREALCIDQVARQVLWQGKPLDLSPTEFDTLAYLIQRAGHPVPYDELLQAVWGASRAQGGSLPQVRSTVKRLRQKLQAVARHAWGIENVRGTGYRLVPASDAHRRGLRHLLLTRVLPLVAAVAFILALGWLLVERATPGDSWAPAWYRGYRVPIGLLFASHRGSFCALGRQDQLYCFDTEEERAAAFGLPLPGVDPARLEHLRESGAVPDLRARK